MRVLCCVVFCGTWANSLLQAVLNDNAQVDKGDNARLSSFVGAIAIADLVKTTLGPKGQRDQITITTVLRSRSLTGGAQQLRLFVVQSGV